MVVQTLARRRSLPRAHPQRLRSSWRRALPTITENSHDSSRVSHCSAYVPRLRSKLDLPKSSRHASHHRRGRRAFCLVLGSKKNALSFLSPVCFIRSRSRWDRMRSSASRELCNTRPFPLMKSSCNKYVGFLGCPPEPAMAMKRKKKAVLRLERQVAASGCVKMKDYVTKKQPCGWI